MRMIRELVFYGEQYDGDWPPTDAAGFMAWFAKKLESIPAECRHTAVIETGSVPGYEGCHYADINIYYMRPETVEEIAARSKKVIRVKESQKMRDLRTLAELKAKYESK